MEGIEIHDITLVPGDGEVETWRCRGCEKYRAYQDELVNGGESGRRARFKCRGFEACDRCKEMAREVEKRVNELAEIVAERALKGSSAAGTSTLNGTRTWSDGHLSRGGPS